MAQKNADAKEKPKRTFKVIFNENEKGHGRYRSHTPYQGAHKAMSKHVSKLRSEGKDVSQHIVFWIVESTKGSKKAVHQYEGWGEDLEEPVPRIVHKVIKYDNPEYVPRFITKEVKNPEHTGKNSKVPKTIQKKIKNPDYDAEKHAGIPKFITKKVPNPNYDPKDEKNNMKMIDETEELRIENKHRTMIKKIKKTLPDGTPNPEHIELEHLKKKKKVVKKKKKPVKKVATKKPAAKKPTKKATNTTTTKAKGKATNKKPQLKKGNAKPTKATGKKAGAKGQAAKKRTTA
jgi:hypothetical protein